MTVVELKAELDALGVEYPAEAKKAELEALVAEATTKSDDADAELNSDEPETDAEVDEAEAPADDEPAEDEPAADEPVEAELTRPCKILTRFIDKYTGARYFVGETVEFTEARIAEINSDKTRIEVAD
jgi:hypothetical protein